MLGLQYFSFVDLWNPWQIVLTVLIGAVYLTLTGPKRTWFANSAPVSVGKKTLFLIGLVVFYFAHSGPLNLLGHLMFSAHMTAMTLAYLVAPPLMLMGIPQWMVASLTARKIGAGVFKAMTQPLIAVFSFNLLFSMYHLPAIHDYVMTHYTVHTIFFYGLLVTAFMMWWPVIAPTSGVNGLSELKKMGYIFANGVLITPACALIIFADSSVFATYSDPVMWAKAMGYCVPANSQFLLDSFNGPQFFAIFDPQEDQQLGGVIMKIMQEITYGAALAYTFFSWYARERKKDDADSEPIVPSPIA
ncbi:MAG: cytochrome c oxidase assembly factor CtaG [Paenibacillus sp.]|nr:cytochrome c oxidase assembly factor CtaG [Paenibacillus sp.]